jgi:hypothetical protein
MRSGRASPVSDVDDRRDRTADDGAAEADGRVPEAEMGYDLQRHLDAGHLMFWWGAMDLEAGRTLRAEPGPQAKAETEIDGKLFVIALRNVIRAAELCRDHAPEVVDAALATFRERVPDATKVRNVIEHFDAYERGEGRLQEKGQLEEIIDWYEFDGETYRLNISGKYVLDVREAKEAAGQLCGDVMAAIVG